MERADLRPKPSAPEPPVLPLRWIARLCLGAKTSCSSPEFRVLPARPQNCSASSGLRALAAGPVAHLPAPQGSAETFHVEHRQQLLPHPKASAIKSRPRTAMLLQACSLSCPVQNVPRGTLSAAATPLSTGLPLLPCACPSPSGDERFPLALLAAESPEQRVPARAAAQRWQPQPSHRQ